MTGGAEILLQRLGLAYRVLLMSTGEMGFVAGQQVRPRGLVARRRALARGQLVLELPRLPGPPDGHPLPARGRAPSRSSSTRSTARGWRWPAIVAALLETYQQPDGSVECPRCCGPIWAATRSRPGLSERPALLSLWRGEVAERLMAALLKSAESKDFVGSNPTLSATT